MNLHMKSCVLPHCCAAAPKSLISDQSFKLNVRRNNMAHGIRR